jgi:hypothetical protein
MDHSQRIRTWMQHVHTDCNMRTYDYVMKATQLQHTKNTGATRHETLRNMSRTHVQHRLAVIVAEEMGATITGGQGVCARTATDESEAHPAGEPPPPAEQGKEMGTTRDPAPPVVADRGRPPRAARHRPRACAPPSAAWSSAWPHGGTHRCSRR